MTMTRDEKTEAVKHICRNVLCQPENSSIEKALLDSGYDDPHSIVSMCRHEIDTISVHPDHCRLIRAFVWWIEFRRVNNETINDSIWMKLDAGDFNAFRNDPNFKR